MSKNIIISTSGISAAVAGSTPDAVIIPLPEWILALIGTEPTHRSGWTLSDAEEALVDNVIDRRRFESEADRVLARYEDEEGLALFPDADSLRARGIDVARLAALLEIGLVRADGLDDMLHSLSVDDVNTALEHLFDGAVEDAIEPDPVERILARHERSARPALQVVPLDVLGGAFDMRRSDIADIRFRGYAQTCVEA